jgi:type II secretory pathway pseudopilin PulG
MFFKYIKNSKGISIIEIIIVASLISIAFVSLLSGISYFIKASFLITKYNSANNFAQEDLEAVRNFRDATDWNTSGLKNYIGTYYSELDNTFSPPRWKLIAGTKSIDGFTRKVIFEKVSRDTITKDIEPVYNAANDDPNTRKISAIVSWEGNEVKLAVYLTNI